jgi:predicted nucleic acid-binding protein
VIRVTLDSNIYIAALQFRGAASRLLGMARAGMFRVDTSDAILSETIGVLRDKFHWEPYRLHFARIELLKFANRVHPTETLNVPMTPTTIAFSNALLRRCRITLCRTTTT